MNNLGEKVSFIWSVDDLLRAPYLFLKIMFENLSQMQGWKIKHDGEQAIPGKGHLKPDDEFVHKLKRDNERLRRERDILKKSSGHLLDGPT